MKIDPALDAVAPPSHATDLQLRPVLSVAPGGTVVFADVSQGAEILDLAPAPPAAGMIAVCCDLPGRLVVLGYVGAQAVRAVAQACPADDGWLVIGTGKAQIRLHPDGRVRVKAEDVTLDSAGRLALRGAFIDLN
jgi:hypothetical protein